MPQICSSQLSQAYLKNYEKNSNVKMLEQNIEHLCGEISNKVIESKDHVSDNSARQLTSLIENKPAVSLNLAGRPRQFGLEQKYIINHRNMGDDHKVEDLTVEIKNLKKNLRHSRKRNRELVKELREERERNRIRKEDFKKIQALFNKYI